MKKNTMLKKLKKLFLNWFIEQDYHSPMTDDLKGKVIVITGASRGIGRSISLVLENEGASLVLISRETSGLNDDFKDNNRVKLINADLTKESDINRVMATLMKKFGRVDVLINNAGVNSHKSLENTSLAEFQSLINLNVQGVFLMCKAVIPLMKRQRDGLIINIGSKISRNPNLGVNKIVYTTSKYALEGFSFALSRELQPWGIRVSTLLPATVRTFFSRSANKFLSPFDVASIVLMLIKFKEIDFESIVFRSWRQNI